MSAGGQLISISLEDLPSLIATYERVNDQDRHIDSINKLRNYKRWKESSAAEKYVDLDVLTLSNGCSSDGLFFFRVGGGVFLSSLAIDETRLEDAVKSVVDYNLVMIRPRQESIVAKALEELGLRDVYEFHEYKHYYCSVEKALQVEYTVPDHVILRQLTADNVEEVDDHLPYKGNNSGYYVRQMIEMLPSVGAFHRETGELMAWVLSYINECHSALTVKPEFRRRGLAKLVTQKLMHDRALQNKPSYCYILEDNVASEQLFISLGFTSIGSVFFGGNRGFSF